MSAIAALATSFKLCDGTSVAIPTAMPEAPFKRTKGNLAGSKRGSCIEPS